MNISRAFIITIDRLISGNYTHAGASIVIFNIAIRFVRRDAWVRCSNNASAMDFS